MQTLKGADRNEISTNFDKNWHGLQLAIHAATTINMSVLQSLNKRS